MARLEIERGFRGAISDYVDVSGPVEVFMGVSGGTVYDFCCFGLDDEGQLSDDRYMVFSNQTDSPRGCMSYSPCGEDSKFPVKFTLRLDMLPETVNKLVFTVSIDGAGFMGGIGSCLFTLGADGEEALSLKLPGNLYTTEKSIIVAEIYRRDDSWRLRAVGGGMAEDMRGLFLYYGGEEADELRKWQKIRLESTESGLGEISVSLEWDKSAVDNIDFGCMYALSDGAVGIVQTIGDNIGDFDNPPYISLEGRTIFINGDRIAEISKILVFAFMYNGSASWKDVGAKITIQSQSPGGRDILIRVNESDENERMFAAAMFENVNDETFSVEKLADFFFGHTDLNSYYRWGIKWGYEK